jgi:hypothetical protein
VFDSEVGRGKSGVENDEAGGVVNFFHVPGCEGWSGGRTTTVLVLGVEPDSEGGDAIRW